MDKFPVNPRIILAGAVSSSHRILQGLLRNGMNVVAVFGLSQEASSGVSGYTRLDDLAQQHQIPYHDFRNINQLDVIAKIRSYQPDLLFAVGLSQLIKPELLSIPKKGCVGFHPTQLPQGRGRAPVAWLILDGKPGAATFFLMDEGADSGPILAQEPFPVSPNDYASDVIATMEKEIDIALDRWLPQLKQGVWKPVPQDERKATYNGKRTPADGLIEWKQPVKNIYALIRATSHPHPGAYTFFGDSKVIIWRATPVPDLVHRGIPGRILLEDPDQGWLVQAGDGSIWLTELEFVSPLGTGRPEPLRVGTQLGLSLEDELLQLKQKISTIENKISGGNNKSTNMKGSHK
jgi:methionyl-tRNA formyltransferase